MQNIQNDDPLNRLVTDGDELDRGRLAEALAGVVGIDAKTGGVVLNPAFNHLDARRKLVAVLLARKAALLLGRTESEATAPKDLITWTGIPPGTVHRTLKELRERRTVSATDSGSYYVAPHQTGTCIELLSQVSND